MRGSWTISRRIDVRFILNGRVLRSSLLPRLMLRALFSHTILLTAPECFVCFIISYEHYLFTNPYFCIDNRYFQIYKQIFLHIFEKGIQLLLMSWEKYYNSDTKFFPIFRALWNILRNPLLTKKQSVYIMKSCRFCKIFSDLSFHAFWSMEAWEVTQI